LFSLFWGPCYVLKKKWPRKGPPATPKVKRKGFKHAGKKKAIFPFGEREESRRRKRGTQNLSIHSRLLGGEKIIFRRGTPSGKGMNEKKRDKKAGLRHFPMEKVLERNPRVGERGSG